MPAFENQILKSERGFFLSWEDLNTLSKKFNQVIIKSGILIL